MFIIRVVCLLCFIWDKPRTDVWTANSLLLYVILGFHGSEYYDCILHGCDGMWCKRQLPTFQRNRLGPWSTLKMEEVHSSKTYKHLPATWCHIWEHCSLWILVHSWCLLFICIGVATLEGHRRRQAGTSQISHCSCYKVACTHTWLQTLIGRFASFVWS
jgi:hypothetical protein